MDAHDDFSTYNADLLENDLRLLGPHCLEWLFCEGATGGGCGLGGDNGTATFEQRAMRQTGFSVAMSVNCSRPYSGRKILDNHAIANNCGEFTIRDEADALTAFAFRNGFLEDLYAGKPLPMAQTIRFQPNFGCRAILLTPATATCSGKG
jgi:hypothetical protein